jgi:hypothetical protein
MKKILSIVATMLTLAAQSQTSIYHPFPDSNAVWAIQAQGCCVNNCPPPPLPNPVLDDYNFSYFIQGDTTISNIYHKVYQSGTIHSHCAFGNFIDNWTTINTTYIGAIRQDIPSKKIYFYYSGTNSECLLYDFNLNVGDQVGNGCFAECTMITSIDSVLVGNNYRKRFNLSSMNYSIIEGIGSTSGLFEPICPFEYSGTLICFAQNGQTLYPDTSTSCNIVSSIDEATYSSSYSISPNPFNTFTTVQLSDAFVNSNLLIYNTLGKVVSQQIIFDKVVTISRNELNSGIYFLKVVNSQRQVVNGKIIIE